MLFLSCNSTSDCQISNSRVTRSAFFLSPKHLEGRLENFPWEIFPVFYQNQNVIYDFSKWIQHVYTQIHHWVIVIRSEIWLEWFSNWNIASIISYLVLNRSIWFHSRIIVFVKQLFSYQASWHFWSTFAKIWIG